MKPIEVFAVVGAGALAAFGLYTYARSRPKAEETVPGIPPQVPTHPGVSGQSGQERTSLCQVLTGYRSKLKEYEDLRADAEKKMRDLESLAQGNCRSYAQDPTFQYHCNGFPVCGFNEWWTVSGTQTNQDAYNACMTFLRAGGSLEQRKHPKKDGNSWDDTWADIDRINSQIGAAYNQVQNLHDQYQEAQRQAEEAQQQINNLRRRISDLEAQGVFC